MFFQNEWSCSSLRDPKLDSGLSMKRTTGWASRRLLLCTKGQLKKMNEWVYLVHA